MIKRRTIFLFAQIGKKKQCVRLQLSVLNWNTPSRDFYAAKGAQDLTVTEGWHAIRFDGQNLDNLANEAPKDWQENYALYLSVQNGACFKTLLLFFSIKQP